MYVCAQLFISYVCMCSVIYKLCMYVLSLLNWNVAILLFIEYDANKIKTIKCHLCHVCAELFIRYVFFHFKNCIDKSIGLDNRLCLHKSSPTTRWNHLNTIYIRHRAIYPSCMQFILITKHKHMYINSRIIQTKQKTNSLSFLFLLIGMI